MHKKKSYFKKKNQEKQQGDIIYPLSTNRIPFRSPYESFVTCKNGDLVAVYKYLEFAFSGEAISFRGFNKQGNQVKWGNVCNGESWPSKLGSFSMLLVGGNQGWESLGLIFYEASGKPAIRYSGIYIPDEAFENPITLFTGPTVTEQFTFCAIDSLIAIGYEAVVIAAPNPDTNNIALKIIIQPLDPPYKVIEYDTFIPWDLNNPANQQLVRINGGAAIILKTKRGLEKLNCTPNPADTTQLILEDHPDKFHVVRLEESGNIFIIYEKNQQIKIQPLTPTAEIKEAPKTINLGEEGYPYSLNFVDSNSPNNFVISYQDQKRALQLGTIIDSNGNAMGMPFALAGVKKIVNIPGSVENWIVSNDSIKRARFATERLASFSLTKTIAPSSQAFRSPTAEISSLASRTALFFPSESIIPTAALEITYSFTPSSSLVDENGIISLSFLLSLLGGSVGAAFILCFMIWYLRECFQKKSAELQENKEKYAKLKEEGSSDAKIYKALLKEIEEAVNQVKDFNIIAAERNILAVKMLLSNNNNFPKRKQIEVLCPSNLDFSQTLKLECRSLIQNFHALAVIILHIAHQNEEIKEEIKKAIKDIINEMLKLGDNFLTNEAKYNLKAIENNLSDDIKWYQGPCLDNLLAICQGNGLIMNKNKLKKSQFQKELNDQYQDNINLIIQRTKNLYPYINSQTPQCFIGFESFFGESKDKKFISLNPANGDRFFVITALCKDEKQVINMNFIHIKGGKSEFGEEKKLVIDGRSIKLSDSQNSLEPINAYQAKNIATLLEMGCKSIAELKNRSIKLEHKSPILTRQIEVSIKDSDFVEKDIANQPKAELGVLLLPTSNIEEQKNPTMIQQIIEEINKNNSKIIRLIIDLANIAGSIAGVENQQFIYQNKAISDFQFAKIKKGAVYRLELKVREELDNCQDITLLFYDKEDSNRGEIKKNIIAVTPPTTAIDNIILVKMLIAISLQAIKDSKEHKIIRYRNAYKLSMCLQSFLGEEISYELPVFIENSFLDSYLNEFLKSINHTLADIQNFTEGSFNIVNENMEIIGAPSPEMLQRESNQLLEEVLLRDINNDISTISSPSRRLFKNIARRAKQQVIEIKESIIRPGTSPSKRGFVNEHSSDSDDNNHGIFNSLKKNFTTNLKLSNAKG
jgi:hypothetical protein